MDGHERLVAAMRRRLGADVEVIETHISTVLLWGDEALKLKKPVDFGFLDFSTLALRRHFCEEELRLNRRYAPHLYLGVAPISGSPDDPVLDGKGEAFEYAVRMRRFDQSALLDRVAREGRLTERHIDSLAHELAAFHAGADVAADPQYGGREHVTKPVEKNFRVLAGCELPQDERRCVEHVKQWSDATAGRLAVSILAQRQREGAIRECHGDLHLGNMLLETRSGSHGENVGEKVTFFDGIEFNPGLRWSDVMSDIAFTVMDLLHHGRADLGYRLLDGYLARTGDYGGLAVLPYYVAYRAMVRAKVAGLRSAQVETDSERDAAIRSVIEHVRLADRVTRGPTPWLILTHGVSGSGKSMGAAALVTHIGAVRLRSDVERKRLGGIEATARSGSPIDGGLYSPEMTEATYDRLAEHAAIGLEAGYHMIVDAANLRRAQRERFVNLAAQLKLPYLILDFHAPDDALRERLAARLQAGADPSEADAAVLEHQLATRQPLGPDEALHALRIDTTQADWTRGLTDEVVERMARLLGHSSPVTP
jgi:aminoglycoside phosphotransferase family enzyme/predicted kinase